MDASDVILLSIEEMKYRQYEKEFLLRVNSKYFSGANLAGTGAVFDRTAVVDNFVIKMSKEPLKVNYLQQPLSAPEPDLMTDSETSTLPTEKQ